MKDHDGLQSTIPLRRGRSRGTGRSWLLDELRAAVLKNDGVKIRGNKNGSIKNMGYYWGYVNNKEL
jgi:hypothetical protein